MGQLQRIYGWSELRTQSAIVDGASITFFLFFVSSGSRAYSTSSPFVDNLAFLLPFKPFCCSVSISSIPSIPAGQTGLSNDFVANNEDKGREWGVKWKEIVYSDISQCQILWIEKQHTYSYSIKKDVLFSAQKSKYLCTLTWWNFYV